MEWEVMFLCNTIGVLLLIFIAFFHLIGVDKEKHGEIIDTNNVAGSTETTSVGGNSKK
jgi:hypothetical protein